VRLAPHVVDDPEKLSRPAGSGPGPAAAGAPAVLVEADLPSGSHRAIE
jgi:hypothetical protein